MGSCGCWQYCSAAVACVAEDICVPPLPKELPLMTNLTRHEPPTSLMHNVLEIICAYAYTTRLFCSSVNDDPDEVARSILTLSAVLRGEQSVPYASMEEALLSFAGASETGTVVTSPSFGAACLHDVLKLTAESGLVALAL